MSSETNAQHQPGYEADSPHGDEEQAHGSFRDYMIGFVLSVVLTAIPFWLVMSGVLGSNQLTAFAIMGFAVVQIVVHMVFFLHMNGKSEGGWTMLALVFTLIIVVIVLAGSLWVMYHLNTNMMPPHDTRQVP
ncbi:cytochrome o ubiquinol oxidase subunit IV [soil metagenome]